MKAALLESDRSTKAESMPTAPQYVTNRVLAIVSPREPFLAWINAGHAPPAHMATTYNDASQISSAFLIPVDGTDDPDELGKHWIHSNWKAIFEHLLGEWYINPNLWPHNRSLQMFREWCEIRIHATLLDCTETPLEY